MENQEYWYPISHDELAIIRDGRIVATKPIPEEPEDPGVYCVYGD